MGHEDGTHRYKATHPWITFKVNLADAPPSFWMLVGEARSKCDHIAGVPLDEETTLELNKVYFAKGVNATTAIEGNSLSEDEVLRRIEGETLELPKSKEYLQREVDNMLAAYNDILHRLRDGAPVALDVPALCSLNKRILDGLELEDGVVPGEIRKHDVRAGTYRGVRYLECERLLRHLCEWLASPEFNAPDASMGIPFAFVKAVIAHIYIEWIHPYGDGNGRLVRVVEFQILISSGVPQAAAHVLTSHYSNTRTEYYRQLRHASDTGGDLTEFLMYAAQGFVDGLQAQIQWIHALQESLMWAALVDQRFKGKATQAAHRQRALAIALSEVTDPIAKSRVFTLTSELAAAYAGKTTKTLTRDLNMLKKMGFVSTTHGTVRARTEALAGLRSFRVDQR